MFRNPLFVIYGCALTSAVVAMGSVLTARARQQAPSDTPAIPLSTGQFLTPQGSQTDVGSYPCNALLSPDGKFLVATSLGARSQISVLDARDGKLISKAEFNGEQTEKRSRKEGLFYGLAFGPRRADGKTTLYAAQGGDDRIAILTLTDDGTITRTDQAIITPTDRTRLDNNSEKPDPLHIAGIATSADGARLYAANNSLNPKVKLGGSLSVVDTASGRVLRMVPLTGYPFAVTAITRGAAAGKKVYVSSEQDGSVSVVDPGLFKVNRSIRTGENPTALLLNQAQERLFVANSGSDSVSVIEVGSDRVAQTIVLRPSDMRGLPATTPLGMALSPDEKTLYVALADINAVAVVDLTKQIVAGYIPAGWYPTAVAVSADGSRLFVTNAKGIAERNPNKPAVPPTVSRVGETEYIENIIKGTVSTIPVPDAATLAMLTAQSLKNNRITADPVKTAREALSNPGIEHVIYIVKENRTYDQVLGDLPQGNGDPSLTLFGRDVTPNQHALAERFVLLDNFYCSGEVSGDGWNWSTQGMANEFNSRNVTYGYTGKPRAYDYEGTNNGVPVDLLGVTDVSRAPGGYIWDNCEKKKVSFRNYGFFTDDFDLPRATAEEGTKGLKNGPTKKTLTGKSSPDYRQYDNNYADSEAWVKHGLKPLPTQLAAYNRFNDPSRITTFRREYQEFARKGNMPRFMMVRFGNDHTQGTRTGAYSPRSAVADNDYAVGQLAEIVSHSPYWKKTAIFVIEDDAQNGHDHVDAHRSIAFVISPFVRKGSKDSRFFNTDSVLLTMENLLGLPPMNLYDAVAPAMAVFTATPENDAPFDAILPAKDIVAEINQKTAYRAADSTRLISALEADKTPDEELNDILWHSIKGINTPMPEPRYSSRFAEKMRSAQPASTRKDND